MRTKACLALPLALMLLMLTACSPLPLIQAQQDAQVALPTPLPALAPVAPVGDSQADETVKVSLMYLSSDGSQLMPVPRTLWIKDGDSLVEQVLGELLKSPRTEGLKSIAPSGTRLLSAELVNGIVTVDLSSEARNQDQQSLISMQVALANTLTSLEGVEHVNILIGGQVEGMGDRIGSLPSGALQKNDNALPAIWLQAQTDENRFNASQTHDLEKVATLYFASTQGGRLMPEARKVRFSKGTGLIMPLLQELTRGPSTVSNAQAVFPKDSEPLIAPPTIITQTDGKRVINVLLRESFHADMERAGLSLRQFYGALTLTLTQFVPEVDGLAVRVGNQRITSLSSPDGDTLTFAGGVMMAADFQALVGEVARVYLASAEGKLLQCGRVLDPYSAKLPRTLIEQLIIGPLEGEPNVQPVMPKGVTPADVLGVRVENDVALINLSSNFYRCAQSLDDVGERLMVYAMVNTLTELHDVRKVRFYVEGEVVDSLTQKIYLRVELIRNPGLIAGVA